MTYPDPAQSQPQYQAQFPPQGYMPPTPPTDKRRNTVGLVALVMAIVGFIFGCIPGALIVGWVLLPVAFILGLVGLFQAGRGKGTSISAIIVSVIGTIVAAVVFLTVVSDALDDAFTPDTATVVDKGARVGDGGTEDTANAVGSRENPAKIGSTLSSDEWKVVVNSFIADATDDVLEANSFNEEPASGNVYSLVNLTVMYTGDDSSYADFVSVAFVSDDGKTYKPYESSAVTPDPVLEGELYKGGEATGNVDIETPKNASGVLRIELGPLGDEAFVSVE
ncbi:DUF4190 domain-containing protein [Gordonia sp. (in: high G+C Gram-positive bacteria)]|uniref:DUF4190 domain-containing protein n=1 Tax=Gordonia sp. (in: high G+C Gram-positive bacteria) TaxID=84139 RepID=UPI003F99A8D8